jgi:hypothetical protein
MDDNYRNSTWFGIGFASLMQLSGINAFIFYSATIF